jgi:hypothetical protein
MQRIKSKVRAGLFFCLFLSLAFDATSQSHDQIEEIKGSWVGKLKVQAMELTAVFNVSANANDSITVTMDSPDQGAKGIATSKVVVTSDSIIIKGKAVSGIYKAAFDPAYTNLTGTWKQGGMVLPLELKPQLHH